jgi:hypothetical protein
MNAFERGGMGQRDANCCRWWNSYSNVHPMTRVTGGYCCDRSAWRRISLADRARPALADVAGLSSSDGASSSSGRAASDASLHTYHNITNIHHNQIIPEMARVRGL